MPFGEPRSGTPRGCGSADFSDFERVFPISGPLAAGSAGERDGVRGFGGSGEGRFATGKNAAQNALQRCPLAPLGSPKDQLHRVREQRTRPAWAGRSDCQPAAGARRRRLPQNSGELIEMPAHRNYAEKRKRNRSGSSRIWPFEYRSAEKVIVSYAARMELATAVGCRAAKTCGERRYANAFSCLATLRSVLGCAAALVRAEVIDEHRLSACRGRFERRAGWAPHRAQHISARVAESVEPASQSSAWSHSRPEQLIPTSVEHGNGFFGGYVRDPETPDDRLACAQATAP